MAQDNIIKLEIVTPERVVARRQVKQVTVPTTTGEITVLPHHIPLVSVLEAGVIELKLEDGAQEVMAVSGGFIEVFRDKVVILADTAERADELDETRIQEARDKAEQMRREAKSTDEQQFTAVAARLEKELARGRAVRRWRKLKGESDHQGG